MQVANTTNLNSFVITHTITLIVTLTLTEMRLEIEERKTRRMTNEVWKLRDKISGIYKFILIKINFMCTVKDQQFSYTYIRIKMDLH